MKGNLIVIEGTDCSGKETQTNLLMEKLNANNIETVKFAFPNYQSPTGKIVGGPYLGKGKPSWFSEGATNVNPLVASLYYAADRMYNIKDINEMLKKGKNVILDRYTYSNMGHQGAKIKNKIKRQEMYNWIEELEFNLLKLPIPNIRVFLHLPYELSLVLKENREEPADDHERDTNHLKDAERSYKEIAKKYQFKTIKCYDGTNIRTIQEINKELLEYILTIIKKS